MESMTDVQILTIAIALATSFLAVMVGVLLNNTRLNDVKELLAARIETRAAAKDLDELRVLVAQQLSESRVLMAQELNELRVLIEKNHSEMLLKISEMDNRLTRIE